MCSSPVCVLRMRPPCVAWPRHCLWPLSNCIISLQFHPHVYKFGSDTALLMELLWDLMLKMFFLYFAVIHFAHQAFSSALLSCASVQNAAISILTSLLGSYGMRSVTMSLPGLGGVYIVVLSLGINAICVGSIGQHNLGCTGI